MPINVLTSCRFTSSGALQRGTPDVTTGALPSAYDIQSEEFAEFCT